MICVTMVIYWLVVGGWGSTPLKHVGSEVVKPLGLAGLAGGIPSEEYGLISCNNFPDHQQKCHFCQQKTDYNRQNCALASTHHKQTSKTNE